MLQQELINALAKSTNLARTNIRRRIIHRPFKYAFAQVAKFFLSRIYRSGIKVHCTTFFGTSLAVPLPACMDIYITGAKSHDSELRLARYMIQNVKTNDTFIDVGAHVGYFSLLAHTLIQPTGKVFAFEPSTLAYGFLKVNTEGLSGIHAEQSIVSNTTGIEKFYQFDALYSEYNALDIEQYKEMDWYRNHPPQHVDTPCTTLDLFCNEKQIIPNYIKIDVEGAELKVLQGAENILNKYSPAIIMEFVMDKRNNTTHYAAAEYLHSLGYATHHIEEDGSLTKIADILNYYTQHPIDSDNILFIKK